MALRLACLDQRRNGAPVLCSSVMSAEESILPVERSQSVRSFGSIVVDLDTADSRIR